jgi:hypothetical protein
VSSMAEYQKKFESTEEAREELKKQIRDYFLKNKFTKASGDALKQQEFYKAFLRKVGELQNFRDPAALAGQTGKEALAEQVANVREALKLARDQYDYRSAVVGQVVTFLKGLQKFEFLRASLSGIQLATYADRMQGQFDKLKEGRKRLDAVDAKLGESLKADADVDAARHALREFERSAKSFLNDIEQASKNATSVGEQIPKIINREALAAYFEQHPTEGMKQAEQVDKAASFVVSAAGKFVPPGYGWITGLVDTARDVAARSAREALKKAAGAEYSVKNMPGSVFDKFTQDPLMMARALNASIKANLGTLLTAIGIGGENIPGWSIISEGIKTCVEGWLDKRIEDAEKAIAAAKNPKLTGDSLKEKVAEVLKDFRNDAKKGLKEKFEDGGFWGGIYKQLESMQLDKDWATELVTIAFEPVSNLVLRLIPATPAQLVTGEDLAAGVEGAVISQRIPDKFRETPTPTTPTGKRSRHESFIIYQHQGNIVDDEDTRDFEGDDKRGRQFVAFNCLGTKVWGYLVEPEEGQDAVWEPETIDAAEGNAPWGKRQLTNDGYVEDGGQKETGGRWVHPTAPKLGHYHLYIHSDGSTAEWLRDITMTKLGRAAAMFAKFSVDEYDLVPQ